MQIIRRVVVFDAKSIDAESRFWAGLLGGTVHRDDDWHSIVVDGEWVMGVQHALYGAFRRLDGDARVVVTATLERYITWLRGELPDEPES